MNTLEKYLLAVDIGGSHISSCLININDFTVKNDGIITQKVNSFDNESIILDCWTEHLAKQLSKDVSKIAIAMPGPFNYQTATALYNQGKKFGSLSNLPIGSILEKKLNAKVFFFNDADCFGIGEYKFGNGRSEGNLIGITLGTGIGSTFIESGKVITDSSDVPPDGEIFNLPFQEGIADDYFSTRWFVDFSSKQFGKQVNGVKSMIDQLDELQLDITFTAFCDNFFIFMSPIMAKFNAKNLVLGGNISKAKKYLEPKLKALFNNDVQIRFSELNETAILLGAAALAKTSINS